jgi:acyl carrier protein
MTENAVFCIVQNIFKNIFNNSDMVITYSTNSDELENWDSLNHINLMSAIEKEFNIKFALGELMKLKNVEKIINLIVNEKLK